MSFIPDFFAHYQIAIFYDPINGPRLVAFLPYPGGKMIVIESVKL